MPTQEGTQQPPDLDIVRRFQANLDDEIDGIAVYRMLAQAERDPDRQSIFEQLADVEERHAEVWRRIDRRH